MKPRISRTAMKKFNLFPRVILSALVASAIVGCGRKEEAPAADKSAENSAGPASRVRHGSNGEIVVTLDKASQEQMGLKVEAIVSTQINPEVKGYGRVLDPAALAAAAGDFTAARAANEASQAELKRLRALAAQNNASERALEAAAAAAARDQAQFESSRLKLVAGWGGAIAERQDLPAFIQSLGSLETALVRIDLPAGESPKSPPVKARLVTLSDEAIEAGFLGMAPLVDPQTQSQGYIFLVQSNPVKLAPGAAVTGYLQVSGEPLAGFVVPRPAVIRHEGEAWIYLESDGTNFVRRQISLQYPMESGWFVSGGVAAGDVVVVAGAQTVFSEELNHSGFMSGGRD